MGPDTMRSEPEWLKELNEVRADVMNHCKTLGVPWPRITINQDIVDRLIEIVTRAQLLCYELKDYEVLPGEYDDLVDILSDEWSPK